ncbi:MAG: SMC-Scp complex subunit ScpB [Bacteroidia bacterium]|nr:SMC-Scp complex subunit ScpB [Bacteroidia bacterium]MDW8334001.1 SMC-Scp complex subunit ScpB [Bacteroidia bacterium]
MEVEIIEAILFVSDHPVRLAELEEIFSRPDMTQYLSGSDGVAAALEKLREKCRRDDCVYELREIAGGYQLLTKSRYLAPVQTVLAARQTKKLSKAALETLAVVAYKHPVTKAEIEHIRGVNSDYAIQKLLEKQLIEPAGRADLPGKPLLYRPTVQFMAHFGINSLSDLPKLKEFS